MRPQNKDALNVVQMWLQKSVMMSVGRGVVHALVTLKGERCTAGLCKALTLFSYFSVVFSSIAESEGRFPAGFCFFHFCFGYYEYLPHICI